MKNVFLIGNGFDISHGLRTTYDDFLFNYILKCISQSSKNIIQNDHQSFLYYEYDDILINLKIKFLSMSFGGVRSKDFSLDNIKKYIEDIDSFKGIVKRLINDEGVEVNFKGKSFLKFLYESFTINGWVDIEVEYVNQLIDVFESDKNILPINTRLIKLNNEFKYLKSELLLYLKFLDINKGNISKENIGKFNQIFLLDELEENKLYINFNYTNTISTIYDINKNLIHIHGKIDLNLEDVFFGYGNERTEKYKYINNKGGTLQTEFLKSNLYTLNDNKNKILEYIQDEKYIVHIVGHSCGESDGELLNRILVNENCQQIIINSFKTKTTTLSENHLKIVSEIKKHFISPERNDSDKIETFSKRELPGNEKKDKPNTDYINSDKQQKLNKSLVTEIVNSTDKDVYKSNFFIV